jgi:hypothetical protein
MAVLLGAALAVAGCQDGYPIPATRCDHFCDLKQATECGAYNPAACVVGCERISGGPACYDRFDELLSCLKEHERDLVCDFSGKAPACEAEQGRLAACASLHAPRGPISAE